MAVVAAATGLRGEHEVIGALKGRGEPLLSEEQDDRRGKEHLAIRGIRFEAGMLPVARQLPVDTDDVPLEVHVRPCQPERFADAQSRVGQKLEQ
jgi:hypothetical protein